MNCIKCKGQIKQIQGASLYRACTLCKGLWLGKKALLNIFKDHEAIQEFVHSELDEARKIDLNCPECQNALVNGKIPDSDIVIEECISCEKYFFDDKEINKLLDHIQHAHLPQAKEIDWSQKAFEQSEWNCPVCKDEPLFGIHGEMDKFEVCLKCNGVATRVAVMQKLVGRSLFSPVMFEFRKGGSLVAYCRFCGKPQERKNDDCMYCHRELKGINCYDCEARMSEYQLHDLVIDRCQMCNSLWLDSGEFERVISITPDVKKLIDRELLHDKLSQVRTEAISTTYALAIEQSRRKMNDNLWGSLAPFGALILY